MNRDELRIGDEVLFGRPNGEKSLGKVIKLNPKAAVIATLNERGNGRSEVGAKWRVAYSLIYPKGGKTPKSNEEEIAYNPFSTIENHLMGALVEIYSGLSPENLHCDGEASLSQVVARKEELTQQLKYTCLALRRMVTEEQAYKWNDLRRENEKVPCSQ